VSGSASVIRSDAPFPAGAVPLEGFEPRVVLAAVELEDEAAGEEQVGPGDERAPVVAQVHLPLPGREPGPTEQLDPRVSR
jgi:hypothetical protein